jgi:hypothetical protein
VKLNEKVLKMTVKRLKEILAEYDDNMPIAVKTYRGMSIEYIDYGPNDVEITDISVCEGKLEILVG